MTQQLQALVKKRPADAVAMLAGDHAELKALFAQYADLVNQGADDERKQELADAICWTLTVHITAKEEVFYPAAASAIDAPQLLDETAAEHHSTRQLIADIVDMKPDHQRFDASVKALGGHVDHHLGQEAIQLLPKVRQSSLDLGAVGERIAARKRELMAELDPAEA